MSRKIIVVEKNLKSDQKEMILDTATPLGYEVSFFNSVAEAEEAARDAEIIYGGGLWPLIPAAKNLKWIHSSWAGVDPYCKPGVMPEDMLLTNASGAFGLTLAEHAVMVTLMLLRHEVFFQENMRARKWHAPIEHGTIKDSRVTLLGAGDIGQRIAERLRPFGPACITAVSRSGKTSATCFDAIYPQSELNKVLAETDILIMSLPGTPETTDVINKETLALLPNTAYIVNVGRGSAIDEAALIEALNSGAIAGAALDVFKHEPLPEDDPLWSAKNILLTPHIAGNLTAPYTRNKNASMFCEDLVNYTEGKPLKYLVDRSLGY